jgi:hypothetical protein
MRFLLRIMSPIWWKYPACNACPIAVHTWNHFFCWRRGNNEATSIRVISRSELVINLDRFTIASGRQFGIQPFISFYYKYKLYMYSDGNKRVWLHVLGIKICWGECVRKYTVVDWHGCICTINSGKNHARYTVHVLWCHAQLTIWKLKNQYYMCKTWSKFCCMTLGHTG